MSLKVETKFDYTNVDFTKENEVHLQIKLIGEKLRDMEERNPLNLVVAIDVSGSMQGNKIDYAKKTLIKLIENITNKDRLSIVAFTGSVWTVCASSLMTPENKEHFKLEVNKLRAMDNTNMSGAILSSENEMFSDGSFDINRVIFLTDGQPTSGETQPAKLINMIETIIKNNDKISYSFFGYGSDVDAELLTSMARKGKGNYYYIDNIDKVKEVFAKELGGLISIVAQNLVIKFTPSKDTQLIEVLNDLDVKTENEYTIIKFDDIYSEEERVLVLKLKLPKASKAIAARPFSVGEVEVNWFNITNSTKENIKSKAKINYVSSTKADTIKDIEVEKT